MTDREKEGGSGEQDDVSFLRTGDIICLTCVASTKEAGLGGTERVSLSAEGFGNRVCYLENVSDKNVPPDVGNSMFYIDQALSVRALQEMMSAENHQETNAMQAILAEAAAALSETSENKMSSGGGGHRTLLYGHAVQLKHVLGSMFLSCLSTCSSSDKLSFDVGLQETNNGKNSRFACSSKVHHGTSKAIIIQRESCWWIIHPASKQRSEGEKVRVGDDVILVSVATERYLHMTQNNGFMVIASFHQTLWSITPVSSGGVRSRTMGSVFGNDVLRFFHGNDECLTIPENWSEHPQHNMVIYEGGNACNQARSLWRLELIRMKWHGALIGWEQVFRVRHITSGRYFGLTADHQVCLLHKEKADFESTAFILLQAKDAKRQGIEEKEEEGMGTPILKYGETNVFLQHFETNLWLSYQTTEVTKKGVGKVEEKKAVALEEGHMDDCFMFFMAQEEESKSARVIRKCSQVLNRFLKGLEALQSEGKESLMWRRVDLGEVLKLMEDLIEYFAQPADDVEFEEKQNKLKALRNRQDLFQEEGVLNMILDTIDQFSLMESFPDFSSLVGEENQKTWEEISTLLYLLVAAMIKGNHSNCAQFASALRLDWLFGRLANPQSAEGILDVLYCVLTESPEALNMITEMHIKSVISLLEKVGREEKVLDVLSSLCLGNGVAVRSSQNAICNNLLPGKDLLLQTAMVDHVASMMPNILVGLVEGSAMFKRWYYEAEVEHIEQMTNQKCHLRVGWANTVGYLPYPGAGEKWGGNGVGDDFFSYGFDGKYMYTGGKSKNVGVRDLQKGDIIGCSLDLTVPEMRFTLNGNLMQGIFKDFNVDGYFFPVLSMSARISCRFILGGDQGKLRYGPPSNFSAMHEAVRGELEIVPCFSFGDITKNVYCGPSTVQMQCDTFVPQPVDINHVILPSNVENVTDKLAENMHELWAMNKIENGWMFAEKRSESKRHHPCLTTYDRLPSAEKTYNLNLARDTLKTILALNYHVALDKQPSRLKALRLPQSFLMSNGYKPAPLDTREIQMEDKMMELVEHLAKNTHNVWAKEKISRGWTYGVNEDPITKRNSHLVPYEFVDTRIKVANKATASEIIRTLMMYGYSIESPNVEHDEKMMKQTEALKLNTRTYRAEKSYAVTSGKWYFEFEVLTTGFMKVGWIDIVASPELDLGNDEYSYAFDGYLVKKWHQGLENYGKAWNVGDVIGCFLDLSDKTIAFSFNGELLLDLSGAEMAFDNVLVGDGFVPAFTLAAGQKAKLNFGQDVNSLKYFTTCGLQEGYEPFCVNMYRRMPLWFNKELSFYENVGEADKSLEVTRIPPSGNNPPCLRVTSRGYGTVDRATLEFIRLSLPVKCNSSFVKNKDRDALQTKLNELHREHQMNKVGPDTTEGYRLPSIPREFIVAESSEEIDLSERTETLVERRASRRGTIQKTQSLDVDEPPLKMASSLEPPALSQRRRISMLRDFGVHSFDDAILTLLPWSEQDEIDSIEVSASETNLEAKLVASSSVDAQNNANNKRSRTPLKMLQNLGQKMRDASVNRNKKLVEEKEKAAGRDKGGRARSTDVGPSRKLVEIDKKKPVQPTRDTSKDNLEIPKSGPGRSSLKMRRGGKKVQMNTPAKGSDNKTGGDYSGASDDDTWEMQQMIEQVDEYYYGLRIFPGQDPAHVWVGWVTPHFHYHGRTFEANDVRKVRYIEKENKGALFENIDMRSCYMVNAQELLTAISGDSSSSSKMSGLLVGCLVDISTGELSFMANGKETDYSLFIEPNTILYPAVFVAPTSKDTVQFELGRIKYTLPLSAALFKNPKKSLQPMCPPRLKLQTSRPYLWSRVPNQCLRVTALKLSDTRGWSVLCDDPVSMMAVYVPERDQSLDILEMIEYPHFIKFHEQTLRLYCALSAQGNQKVAHILCKHVDELQLMYAISNHFLAGPLRCAFHELLIAVHLETHAEARQNTTNEYIIPLTPAIRGKNVFSDEALDTFPPMTGESYSIRPIMAVSEIQDKITKEVEKSLRPPTFSFGVLKQHVMDSLADATYRAVMNCRDLIGGDTYSHFQPLIKLLDKLLVIGLLEDDDVKTVLMLLDPRSFDESWRPGSTQKGLMEVNLAEGVKLQLCSMLNHLADIEMRHQVESLIAFSEGYVGEAQQDQLRRYIDIKQSDMGPAEAAKKTKEFRCPPKEQMLRLLNFKNKDEAPLDEEGEVEECPMSEHLQEVLLNFHEIMIKNIGCKSEEAKVAEQVRDEATWLDKLASMLVPMPPAAPTLSDSGSRDGRKAFKQMIIITLAKWAKESFIDDTELIRELFGLLLRQYNGVAEVMGAMRKTYVIHERNVRDIENFIIHLSQVRGLLTVQFESVEEEILKSCLWHLQNNKVFFQHPDLMRILRVHENVMTVMVNVLGRTQRTEVAQGEINQMADSAVAQTAKDNSEMVVACCKFLCYFCRTSSQNQKAMFEHLPFLLDNATMLLARPSLRGSVPLDVAYSSFMDNNELALALKEDELEKVAVYLSRCGLQPNQEMVAKGYPDISWDPVEGERYIDFLRFCVWVNGETVEENANLVIRLLIRRPECLGPALKGEGQGLFRAFKEAISMSEEINSMQQGGEGRHGGVYLGDGFRYPRPEDEGEDYIDLGASILDFYSSLVDLLGKCAPDPVTISAGKGESLRARAILRSLISLEDLEAILSLRFLIPNVLAHREEDDQPHGLLPIHKQSVLLFLDRVYGVDTQEMFFRLLEKSFLPDLRAVTMLDHPNAAESDTALALNRYLCNAVLPLLSNHSHFFADAEHQLTLVDAILHTVYRMSKLKSLTNNQRSSVSDFLVAITREMNPPMMLKLLRKVVVDIPSLSEFASVPLRIMTLHYERCGKYYGTGSSQGVASEEEKRLTMILFTSIFDSLGKRAYDPDLFGRALPCLTAIGSSLSPDYTLTTSAEDESLLNATMEEGLWTPKPVDVSGVHLNNELQNIAHKFAEHFHDSWASRKIDKGWTHGEIYSRTNMTHPRLKPYQTLKEYEKNFYYERCAECIRALLAFGYQVESVEADSSHRGGAGQAQGGIQGYNPRPVDLSNMTLNREMGFAAEKMAENAHLIWAKKTLDDITAKGGGMLVTLVPWDILTDSERQKNRFSTQEILKFLQYHGYKVSKPESSRQTQQELERASVEKRFAYSLLEKLLLYQDNAALKMKTVKPSQGLTRRNSFKQSSQDVKFFSKVVLPLLQAYFKAHRRYFLTSSLASQTGVASNKEKEMVTSLFCRMNLLLRRKLQAFGCDAKPTVSCLQVLVQAIDTRTLVKINSDIVRTSLLMFFNNAAEDMLAAVKDVKQEGQYSAIRGANLKSWVSLEYANQVLIPVLTVLFNHLARNNFGQDLLLDEIQVACYKILDSLYSMTLLSTSVSTRKSIKEELEKHRPALGQCLSAFASCFPVAFLEPEYNTSNKYSVLAKSQDQSVQAQEMLHSLSANIPPLDKLITDIEQLSISNGKYMEHPNIFDVDLPMVCSYLTYWWDYGPDGTPPERQVTKVDSEYINRNFAALLRFIGDHMGIAEAQWLCRVASFAQQTIVHVTSDPVKELMLPVAEKLRHQTEQAFKEEDRLRTHPEEVDEGAVAELNAMLVRDIYSFFPLLIKFTDLHRAQWLKSPSWETDGVYENVAIIFRLWSRSQHFKREELNYMAQFEDESAGGEMKTGKAAIAERKKKRREGKTKNKEAGSIVVQCFKRQLPVGLNIFGGRELDIVQHSKEKFLQQEQEDKIRDFIRSMLGIPEKTDPTDKNMWQRKLYHKIGKAQMRDIDSLSQDAVIEKIAFMGHVLSILHMVEHPQTSLNSAWRKIVSTQRKRAVVACFRMVALYIIPRHRAINLFLPAYQDKWLTSENEGQDQLIADLTEQTEDEAPVAKVIVKEDGEVYEEAKKQKPDPITQLVQCFQRAATSEQKQVRHITEDKLYMDFSEVMAKSIHISEEDDDGGGDEEPTSREEQEIEKQQLISEQGRLAERGGAIMVLMYLSACNGDPSDMVEKTFQLANNLLNGGNIDVQTGMLNYLQEKKDVRFFTSLAGLMSKCSVLKVEMFERQIKAEGLGMGAELAAGEHQNLNDADFICSLFRFLQLTCEGHNQDFQNYLRAQPGNTTSINLIICTVDYLLRLQESIMDFYWLYSSKDVIDEPGKQQFLRAISVCSQVFNTLTESIQGPCLGNQMALATSRLWDAINGFFFLFAHMMDKLSKNSSQLELLREFLGLQKDMIVLMLSMLEGNVLNGQIGKQMVDTLVESQQNVELILKFFDMFLKLKDLTTSTAFQEFDTNKDGWISPKEFQRAMETQKMYSIEEINYLMMCTDINNDGKVDYMEFTERFHNPAKDIGFNLAVLLTNMKEHITGDNRLQKILQTASNMLDYFDKYMGRVEIMGSSKRVEKVYFEIKDEWLEQWNKQQIKQSKKEFLFNVMQDGGGDQGKLEAFVNFCEDTIFEMSHATKISAEDSDSRIERAKRQRDNFMGGSEKGEGGVSIGELVKTGFGYSKKGFAAGFNLLRPSHLRKSKQRALNKLASMTYGQLLITTGKLTFRSIYLFLWSIYFFLATLCRFILFMMGGRKDEDVDFAALPMPESRRLHKEPSQNYSPVLADLQPDTGTHIEAFGIHIAPEENTDGSRKLNMQQPENNKNSSQSGNDSADERAADSSPEVPPTPTPPVVNETPYFVPPTPNLTQVHKPASYYEPSVASGPAGPPLSAPGSEVGVGLAYEPKIAETAPKSKSSFLGIFARHYFLLKRITLVLAGLVNFVLMFYRVNVLDDGSGSGETSGSGESNGNEGGGSGESDQEPVEEILLPIENDYYLNQILIILSLCHSLAALALLIAYYQLKVPLIVFKREKEVARKAEFEGMWITEQATENQMKNKWDGMVISATSFPVNYWDKFVKKKVKDKYKDQFDEAELNRLLGLDKVPSQETGFLSSMKNYDWRYQIWKFGVILADPSFQYQFAYFLFSASGNVYPFFYAIHLLDIVLSSPMLQTILKSVTHNGTQLLLTVMMVLVVVYLYTVLAFNFFRKSYVQEEEGEIDRKCHNMVTCFVFNLYAGVRAGGGIGDELESPYGDANEKYRILFDMSFHFFVIIILLAIMQGLIIDAFGELRDQQESAQEKLESNCFICDLAKDFFDKLPRGFEHHTDKEHNLANYLFFLMHLINKDETEYTGQETYVHRLYEERCWDFFPVGECFLKQYEDQLMVA